MSHTINEELANLASEFAALRQVKKNKFPKAAWQKAISIAQRLPLIDVCQAINITPAYLRAKIKNLNSLDSGTPIKFVEVSHPKYEPLSPLTINIETSFGYKLTVQGATTSCLVILLNEFFKESSACCK